VFVGLGQWRQSGRVTRKLGVVGAKSSTDGGTEHMIEGINPRIFIELFFIELHKCC